MKSMKHLLILLLLTVSTGFLKTVGEDFDESSFDIANKEDNADNEREELEKSLRTLKTKSPKINSTSIDVNAEPKNANPKGFFDSISNWSNKRTLSKFFTAHAKSDVTDGPDLKDNQKTMWKSLSPKDQQELINEWSEVRKKKTEDTQSKDLKKYKTTLDNYNAQDKKETLAKVDNAKKEISKIEKELAKVNEKIDSATQETRKRTLNRQKVNLEKLITTYKEVMNDYLLSIKYEEDLRKNRHNKNQKLILENDLKKINNFINSINALDGSKVNVFPETAVTAQSSASDILEPQNLTNEEIKPTDDQPSEPAEPLDTGNESTEEGPSSASEPLDTANEDFTTQQIKSLTTAELKEKLENIVESYTAKGRYDFNRDPEYIKLETEETSRKTKDLLTFISPDSSSDNSGNSNPQPLTDEEISDLSDAQLQQKINELTKNIQRMSNNPSEKFLLIKQALKLSTEMAERNKRATEPTESQQTSGNLENFKTKTSNWSYNRMLEEINDPENNYSSDEMKVLENLLSNDPRLKKLTGNEIEDKMTDLFGEDKTNSFEYKELEWEATRRRLAKNQ